MGERKDKEILVVVGALISIAMLLCALVFNIKSTGKED